MAIQFSSLIVFIAPSNFYLVFFKFIENFFTIFFKLNIFLLCILVGICGHSQMSARMPFITARARTPSLVNTPVYIVAFTTVSYKLSCGKCRLEHICARFWKYLSGEAFNSTPHLLRVGILFLHHFMLSIHNRNRNWPNGPFIAI